MAGPRSSSGNGAPCSLQLQCPRSRRFTASPWRCWLSRAALRWRASVARPQRSSRSRAVRPRAWGAWSSGQCTPSRRTAGVDARRRPSSGGVVREPCCLRHSPSACGGISRRWTVCPDAAAEGLSKIIRCAARLNHPPTRITPGTARRTGAPARQNREPDALDRSAPSARHDAPGALRLLVRASRDAAMDLVRVVSANRPDFAAGFAAVVAQVAHEGRELVSIGRSAVLTDRRDRNHGQTFHGAPWPCVWPARSLLVARPGVTAIQERSGVYRRCGKESLAITDPRA